MRELVVAVLLALVAICANAVPVEEQKQRFFKKAVDHYIEFCEKEILEDWLRIPALVDLEHSSLYEQADDCQWWLKNRDRHARRFADCYDYGFEEMHERIREATSGDELKLYERRMKIDKACNRLQERVKKEFGNDWDNVPQDPPKPVDETLSLETCAESNLVRGEGFKLPAGDEFIRWSRSKLANFCEEAYERTRETGIDDCTSKYRVSDYLRSYSEKDKKRYHEIRKGRMNCESVLNIQWDWSEELPLEEVAGEKTSDEDSEE